MKSYARVAVIGPQDSVSDCLQFAVDYPWLMMESFSYESEDQTPEIVRSLGNAYNVILFTGPIPYFHTKDMDELANMPCTYIPFNGNGLYRALFQARHLKDFYKVSIDTISQQQVAAAYQDLGLAEVPHHILEYNHALSAQEFVEFHKRLYEKGETELALTCLRSCHRELVRAGVPSVRIFPLHSDIREILDRISLISESLWNRGHQIAVGVIAVDGFNEWSRDKSMHDAQRFHLQLSQSLFRYVENMDGHFLNTSPGEFLFFTTRALVEKSTELFTQPPILQQQIFLPDGLTVSMGIGVGGTAKLAADHARTALQKSQEHGGNVCFVVNEENQVIGPLGDGDFNTVDLRTTNEFLLEAAKKTGLSAASLNRLFTAIQQAGMEFTANEVGAFLGMTLRSTRRLLRQLEQAGLLDIIGQESMYTRGKPRRVYRLREGGMARDTRTTNP